MAASALCRARSGRRPTSSARSITRPGEKSPSTWTMRSSPDGPGRFPVSFFHLGNVLPESRRDERRRGRRAPVKSSTTRAISPCRPDSVARKLPQGAGFAGLRVQEPRGGALDWRKNDWVAFLGAAYFRAIGALHQYGLSARAVAIDVAVAGKPEEFPDFTKFYIDGVGCGRFADDLRPARRTLHRRRLPLCDDARQRRHHGYRPGSVPARRHRKVWPRAVDHDVLVLRNQEGDRDRLASGGP